VSISPRPDKLPRRPRRRAAALPDPPPRSAPDQVRSSVLEALDPLIDQLVKESVGAGELDGPRKTVRSRPAIGSLTRSLDHLDGAVSEVAEAVAGLTVSFPPELVDQIVARVAEVVLARLESAKGDPTPEWLTTDQAAAYIGAKRQRIYDLVNQRKLNPAKDGRLSKFRRTELDAYLERGDK
jgi:excisionase family DNA binding protein